MPYSSNDDLPDAVKRVLPSDKARSLWRRVFNDSMKRGYQEGRSFGAAYAAIDAAGFKKDPKTGVYVEKKLDALEKASGLPVPLYGYRPLLNAQELVDWAKSNGYQTPLAPEDMHVTIVYSKTPLPMPNTDDAVSWGLGTMVVRGGNRRIMSLGDASALVLDSVDLVSEWNNYRSLGASWDFPSYMPHVSISYSGGPIDIAPFTGDLVLGPIKFEPIKDDASSLYIEKALYQGREVELDKPFRLPAGASKKFGVYVTDGDKVKKVTFGDPSMEIRRDDPEARASFRARHSCDTATDKTSARYWSCRMWESGTSVSEMTKMEQMEKRQISDDVFTTVTEAVQRSHQLGLGLVAHMTEGPDGQAFYMPGESHEAYLELVGEAGMIGPDGAEVENPAAELIESVVSAAIEAVIEATMEKRAAKIIKLDDEARIVWGWASVVSVDGKPMVDRQGDIISADVMTKAADRFMLDVRVAKAMHEGEQIGEVIHSFPLTKALGEALGVHSALEGWIVAMKVHDDGVWNRVKSGELAAFSIGGMGKRNAV